MNALGGAVRDDYGVCHRTRGFRLEGPLPAQSVSKPLLAASTLTFFPTQPRSDISCSDSV